MWNAITFNGPLVNVDGSIKDIVGGYKSFVWSTLILAHWLHIQDVLLHSQHSSQIKNRHNII